MFDAFSRPIHYLRISVTDRCNLRCRYCMPEEGVPMLRHDDVLRIEEIQSVVAHGVKMGINKVRLTGGEPLVRRGVLSLVEKIASLDGVLDFGMTTNGIYLPGFAKALKSAGLHRINVSLDTLNAEKFSHMTRGGNVAEVLAGIHAAVDAGFVGTKLNCVVRESEWEEDAQEVAAFGKKMNIEVRFIRRMNTERGEFWSVMGGEGGNCASCNRLRLSSNGYIYPCLFSDKAYSVRKLGIDQAYKMALENKPECGCRSNNQFHFIGG